MVVLVFPVVGCQLVDIGDVDYPNVRRWLPRTGIWVLLNTNASHPADARELFLCRFVIGWFRAAHSTPQGLMRPSPIQLMWCATGNWITVGRHPRHLVPRCLSRSRLRSPKCR